MPDGWFRSYGGRVAAIVLFSLWVVQAYLVYAQWADLSRPGKMNRDGWHIVTAEDSQAGLSIYSPKNNQIAKSLGSTGDGSCGWCTNCSARGTDYVDDVDTGTKESASCKPAPITSSPPKCSSDCWGSAGKGDVGIGAGSVFPRGTSGPEMTSADDCRRKCQQQYNAAMGPLSKAGKVATTNIENACNAWEWRDEPATCFTYVLASYPPKIETQSADITAAAWAVDIVKERTLLRQVAAALVALAPLAMLYVAYNNYYYSVPGERLSILASAVPVAAAIATMAFLGLVGFRDTTPAIQFTCNGAMNQKCTADARTGGRSSGTCFNKCCGMTVSCLVPDSAEGIPVYSTCTWPNVMCRDGSCAAGIGLCKSSNPLKDHGGLMPGGDTTTTYCFSGGAKVQDGASYGPDGSANLCYAPNTIENKKYPYSKGTVGDRLDVDVWPWGVQQYQGEPNRDLTTRAVSDLGGQQVLPPGRSDGKGAPKYLPFQMSKPLHDFLMQIPTSANKPIWGCGLDMDRSTNREGLFLSGAPRPLQCVVPKGVTATQ